MPKILNANHKDVKDEISQTLSDCFAAEGDSHLMHILTGDRLWLLHYTPETKRSSMEYCAEHETTPVAVSYTHLDVYKRQGQSILRGAIAEQRRKGRPGGGLHGRPRLIMGLSLIHI